MQNIRTKQIANGWDVNPEDAWNWEDMRFAGLDHESSMQKQTSQSYNPIQELLWFPLEVINLESRIMQMVLLFVHSRGRRGHGGRSVSRSDPKVN